MKTVAQIIDAARCEFRPDNAKKCGHKHSDSSLRAAFEVKENGELVFRGYICEKCIQRMSDVPNLGNYSLWPIAEFAAQLARNTLLRDTGNNGGGQGRKRPDQRHQGQRNANPRPTNKPTAKVEAPQPQPQSSSKLTTAWGELLVTNFGLPRAQLDAAMMRATSYKTGAHDLRSEVEKTPEGRQAVVLMLANMRASVTSPAPVQHPVTTNETART